MKTAFPNIEVGLTNKEVKDRISKDLVNHNINPLTRSIPSIIIKNVFTLFNFLNIGLAVAIFFTKSYKNLLFLGVIICNTLISTFQEIKSKKIIDKLSLLSEKKVKVRRNAKEIEILKEEIVLDDLLILSPGNQVVADAIVVDGTCQVNESFITGESDNITKSIGDHILSGSFIAENEIVAKVEHIGADNYTSKITKDAKYIKKINSELMKSLNTIIKIISISIIPIGLLLFYKQMKINGINDAIINTVAALIGMIPDGLILLTSTVLAASTIRLSKQKVLVQELFCIETLAHVDTLCIDKTGTITEGYMELESIIPISKDKEYIDNVLHILSTGLSNDNQTIDAIKRKYKKIDIKVIEKVPFASSHKFSSVTTDKTYIMGAPSIIVKDQTITKKINELSKKGRVLVLAESKTRIINKQIPSDIEVIGLVVLKDKIRNNASTTLNYFKEEGVEVKIISGDGDVTVSEIAKRVGFDNVKAIDLYDKSDEEVESLVEKYNIFARVTPTQKKIIVKSLKNNNHTVAMVGDGVNDVLALKESDCSIAMASGTDAARNVSQLVLLDSNFDSIPKILKEGRRSINNIERSATLFITKTIYASLLAIMFIIVNLSYPFEPIQLSLYNLVTIGIPSLVLGLEPNNERIKGHFFLNVLRKAIPTSLTVIVCILLSMCFGSLFNLETQQLSTVSILVLIVIGFRLLYDISLPFNKLRERLFIFLVTLFLTLSIVFHKLYSLVFVTLPMSLLIIVISLLGLILYEYIKKIVNKIIKKDK